MVRKINIYIEGDTKQKGIKNSITLRQGFKEFFRDIDKGNALNVKLCGGREDAIKIFLNDITFYPKSFLVLLVDAETSVRKGETPKIFLQKISDKFDFSEIDEDQCHLMVQAMESWFLADKESLAKYYGQNFKVKSLPQNPDVEKIRKKDIFNGLKNATKDTSKGEYKKGSDSGEILRRIDSQKVRDSAPHCERLFQVILDKIG